MKRIKYSNGSEVQERTVDKNIAGLNTRLHLRQQPSRSRLQNYPEQNIGFDPGHTSVEATGSKKIGSNTRVTGSIYRDTSGGKNVGASVEQQLPGKTSITVGKNKQGTNVRLGKGPFSIVFTDPKIGKNYYGIRFDKQF